jgi:hypothetical protein
MQMWKWLIRLRGGPVIHTHFFCSTEEEAQRECDLIDGATLLKRDESTLIEV